MSARLFTLLALLAASPAMAQSATNLITNGDFDSTTNGQGALYTGTGSIAGTTAATGWSACSTTACNSADGNYPFLFIATPGIADGAGTSGTTGFYDPWDDSGGAGSQTSLANVAVRDLWGAGNGGVGQNGSTSTAFNGYGPTGTSDTHNFLIADGDYHATAIQQTLTNLVVGDHYSLSFAWAAGQWINFSGATTETWNVTFGAQTQSTATYSLNSHSFSGWMTTTMNFTASATTQTLSFLASGGPSGEPPILLLDQVALYDTPEPGTLAVMLAGIAGIAAARRRSR